MGLHSRLPAALKLLRRYLNLASDVLQALTPKKEAATAVVDAVMEKNAKPQLFGKASCHRPGRPMIETILATWRNHNGNPMLWSEYLKPDLDLVKLSGGDWHVPSSPHAQERSCYRRC
mmetsp:Transcript_32310/g.65507  ORF Transcript_32310/g.65507 Transcript_32310/m.65507 type:complete len:118 (+) Transcript_32310:1295-1648(+)